jgi:hypothetical protein
MPTKRYEARDQRARKNAYRHPPHFAHEHTEADRDEQAASQVDGAQEQRKPFDVAACQRKDLCKRVDQQSGRLMHP